MPAASKIAAQFFEIIELAKAENDCYLLPDAANKFNAWTPNFQAAISGEKILIMTMPLHLYGPIPQAIKGAAQVFDYSRMVGRFYEPDDKICLIFSNEHYSKLRELPEFADIYKDDAVYGSLRN